MALAEINGDTLKDSVYKELVKAIVSGAISPGERVTLEGLAKQLNVSVMPVREAVRKLEAGNFLTIHKRRITINRLSPDNVRQILEARLVLECYAAEKASFQRSEEALDKLEELLETMVNAREAQIYTAANKAFHDTIYHEAGVPVIVEIINTLWERYNPYLMILNQTDPSWDADRFVETHQGILNGLRRRDPIEVRKWLEKDLVEAANLIIGMLEDDL